MLAKSGLEGVENVKVREMVRCKSKCSVPVDARKTTIASGNLQHLVQYNHQILPVVQGFLPEDTFMDVALKSLKELMKQHIIGNPKNKMAICFYDAVHLCLACALL
jgi:hypothetical protein